MATIVYLDVEDEITSAAARIRTAAESRVALVLPFGSRLATSRINFRLLAREAMTHGRRLDIVSPDASSRALAASAGLPVYGSIGEYESALEAPAPAAGDGPAPESTAAPDHRSARGTGDIPAAAPSAALAAGMPRQRGLGQDAEQTHAETRPTEVLVVAPEPAGGRRREPQVVRPALHLRIGPGALAGFGLFVAALVVACVAAFVFLPSAEIAVTPQIVPIGPISLTVRADPAATAVDAAKDVIPAQTLDIPVQSSGQFPVTGKRVVEAAATGGVTFDSINTIGPVAVPKGTRVSTLDGVVFTTDGAVIVPRAKVTGNRIQHGVASVAVTALAAGSAGNVAPGAISQTPGFLITQQVSVTNPAATTGGKRDEFPKVAQADVDAAITQLRKDIEGQFASALLNGANAAAGSTVFPGTGKLGDPTPSVDPATLVGQEVTSFTLAMSATGTVLTVDSSPLKSIAESHLRGAVAAGYELVAGSISVTVGEGTVTGGVVAFPVQGSAKQVRPLDAATLKRQVLGLGQKEAKALLATYGTVQLRLWPDWVTSVPSLEQRVTLSVGEPLDATPSGKPSAVPSAAPSAGGSGGAPASQPVPSGG